MSIIRLPLACSIFVHLRAMQRSHATQIKSEGHWHPSLFRPDQHDGYKLPSKSNQKYNQIHFDGNEISLVDYQELGMLPVTYQSQVVP